MTTNRTSADEHQSAVLASISLAITGYAPLPLATVEGADHIMRYANPAFCRLLDKPVADIVGKPFADLLPDKDECLKQLDWVFWMRRPATHTEQGQGEPQSVFWSYSMWPVMVDERAVGVVIKVTETETLHEHTVAMNEELMLGSVRQHELTEAADLSNAQLQAEIIDRKRAEEGLRRAQALLFDRAGQLEGLVAERTTELTATNQQLEAFVYSIAHDLRAPLRSMQGFSVLLAEEAGAALSERGQDYAKRINKSAQFMDALLSDLLTFSRISQRHVVLTAVKLDAVLKSVLSRLGKDIQEIHARIESIGPWPDVLAHESTVGQVLFNLTSNALKFVVPGVLPVVRFWTEERAEFVRVWVEDNGPGIAPEHQDQIFRLFIRLDGEKYPGTGLGLTIVQKGIERMGGRVGVESAPGQGSRFWFELRRA